MSFGFGFALPAYPLRGGTGNNPFNQLGPTLDLSFVGTAGDLSGADTYTLNTDFITPEYQVAAQYAIWENGVGLAQKTFSQIVTFSRTSGATWFNSAGVNVGIDFSTSSVAIGTGSKTFTLTATAGVDRSWTAGDIVRISEQATLANFMDGTVTSYTASTQTLVVNVTATGGSGTIASWRVSSHMPRFDYNPATLAAQGLLIEEQRTNLCLQSEDWGSATWSKSGSTITANATTAPTGTTVADKLVEDTSTGTHITTQSISLGGSVDNSAYVISVFAKASERTRFQLFDNAQASSGITSFDLSNGTVVSGTGTITAVGNGWYRCSVFPLKSTSITSTLTIRLISTGTTTSYTGDGTSGLFLWGAQLEAGAFPTSYIPTTVAQVTRNRDEASVNTLSPWWNASEGTFYVEGSAGSLANSPIFVMPHDGTSNNYLNSPVLTTAGLARLAGAVGGAAWTNVNTANSTTANTTFKSASAFKAGDQAICLNAGTVATGVNASVPVVTTVKLGDWRTSGNSINGYLRRLTYYPRRLPNADLQTITA